MWHIKKVSIFNSTARFSNSIVWPYFMDCANNRVSMTAMVPTTLCFLKSRKPQSIFREFRFPYIRIRRRMFPHKRRKKRETLGRTECVTLGTATHNSVRAIMSRAPLDTTRYRANNFLRLASVNLKKSNVRYIMLLRIDRQERPTKSERSPFKSPTFLHECDAK